jgi:hypothetical protein
VAIRSRSRKRIDAAAVKLGAPRFVHDAAGAERAAELVCRVEADAVVERGARAESGARAVPVAPAYITGTAPRVGGGATRLV